MRTILHLCADIGSDSKYYQLDPEYQVIMVGESIGVENFNPPQNVHGIIANPVCTEFSTAKGFHKENDVVFREDAEELLDEGNSVICFVNFHASVDALHNWFPGAGLITGKQKPDEIQETVRLFQANELRMLIAITAVGGVSINLHDTDGRFPRVSLLSPSFDALQLIQALGRTVRGGGKSVAIRKIIFAADTVEEMAYNSVRRKINTIDTLTDGDLTTFKD